MHISDVTSYKHLINRQEIANKGTSIYLPHKTIHMMPPKLVAQLALQPKKRRLAFSAFFKIDLEGNVLATRFEKTVVKSCAQLTYEEAQAIMDSKADEAKLQKEKKLSEEKFGRLKEKLMVLRTIAFNRRQLRSNG